MRIISGSEKKEYTREIEVARNFTPPKTKNMFIKYSDSWFYLFYKSVSK